MTINGLIDEYLLKQDEADRHEHSDKLTAGYLYQAKRFQLLKHLGVPEKPKDAYTLAKFQRGRDVEDRYVKWLKKIDLVEETQKEVTWLDVKGRIDIMVDHEKLGDGLGIIPHEVKSVTAYNFTYIAKKGEIPMSANLQAGWYGMACHSDKYSLDFINANDLQIFTIVLDSASIQPAIEDIIRDYNLMIKNHDIPEWDAKEKWQNEAKYMPYDEFWATCSEKDFRKQLKLLNIDY